MIYAFEDFELDTALFELRRAGRPRPLEPQVFDVLAYLVTHRDRVVGKDELLATLWGGRAVTESTLSSRIKAARQALEDSGREQRLLATVHRRGYRFVAAVGECASVARDLVQGSVWETGDRLRVSVQLLAAASGRLLWAHRAEVAGGDLGDVQDDVVAEIVSCLEPEILRAELPALRRRRAVDLGAWALYRRAHGIIGMKGWSEETVTEATALLRQAVRQDPDLAFAHGYLALVLAIGHLMGLLAGPERKDEARRAAERALAIDAQDSDVLGYAGCALADLGDLPRGIDLIERATRLDPSNAQARAALGAALLATGDPEGVEHLRRGMRISPRDNRLAVWGALLARGLLRLERTAEAIEAAREACRCDDKIFLPRVVLAIACAEAGALDDAAAAMSDARRIRPRLARADCAWMATAENLETLVAAGLL